MVIPAMQHQRWVRQIRSHVDPNCPKNNLLQTVDCLSFSNPRCVQDELQYLTRRLRACIRNGYARNLNNLPHDHPVLHGQIARQRRLQVHCDLLQDESAGYA
jgi:hypothetical protein